MLHTEKQQQFYHASVYFIILFWMAVIAEPYWDQYRDCYHHMANPTPLWTSHIYVLRPGHFGVIFKYFDRYQPI